MTQEQRIVEYIQAHGGITPNDAFGLGITRLAARVNDMRRKGIPVVTDTIESINQYGEKTHFARYRIEG